MKAHRRIMVGVALASVITLGAGLVQVVRKVSDVPNDAYAMWGAGELLVEHLKRNSNTWPSRWGDLEQTYRQLEHDHSELRTNGTVVSRAWDIPMYATFEQIQSRVMIDWNVNVGDLAAAPFTNSVRPFRVIRLLNGKGTHYTGAEPNAEVWSYLQPISNQVSGGRRSAVP